ncbi:amidohydrolase family protein [Brevibacillus daliensis]|uniref:amidohydrolase family protein n=1 Tax=Brevibacillus daliensis TaxID=2892995 RepID=UPI001E2F9D6C|nr:amidohydrolase family protein [Brevibacillus daliensis]
MKKLTIIKDAEVLSSHSSRKTDIWIQDGKILRMNLDTLSRIFPENYQVEYVMASDYYVLPGFVTLFPADQLVQRSASSYINQIRKLIEQGTTSFVATIPFHDWMDDYQLLYKIYPHYNSILDYAIRIQFSGSSFKINRLKRAVEKGFCLFEIVVEHEDQLHRMDWEQLSIYMKGRQISLHVTIPSSVSTADREKIIEHWNTYCVYYKIRTRYEMGVAREREEEVPFFLIKFISQMNNHDWKKMMLQLDQDEYQYLPVILSPELLFARRETRVIQFLSMLVRFCSTNPAKMIGCYPQKGNVQSGADADLIFLNKDIFLTKDAFSTMLTFSEMCNSALVMSKGMWIYRHGMHESIIGTGKYLQHLKPYNYAL